MISHVNNAIPNGFNRRRRGARRPVTKQRPRSAASVAALGYLAQGQIERGLIPIEELSFVVLHGDAAQPRRWLAGYSGQRVPWGVAWGGVERNEFLKDLMLPPRIGGCAAHLDPRETPLAELTFRLSQLLEQHRTQRLPAVRRRLELPRLWAGFEPAAVDRIKPSGPELMALCQHRRKSARLLLRSVRRTHRDLILLPLDWVSHRWRDIACVFADIGRFRKRQLFRLRDPAQDLVGYRGAAEFDFFHSRFRRDGF